MKSKTRQLVRMIITSVMMLIVIMVVIAVNYNIVYLDVLKSLSLPLTIILGGYFSVESIKNIKK